MKTLIVDGDVFEAEKIFKTDSNIIGYNGDNVIFHFSGVNDFSKFIISDSYDIFISQEDRIKELENTILFLLERGV